MTYYVSIDHYRKSDRRVSSYFKTTYMEFPTLDKARERAIQLLESGYWTHSTALIANAIYPNSDVMKFIGGGVKCVHIGKSKENVDGGVVPNRGKFYWVPNTDEKKKYLLNRDGTIDKEVVSKSRPKKDEGLPFGL